MLENKSGNISETRKDRGKVTMDGLQKLTNGFSKNFMGFCSDVIARKSVGPTLFRAVTSEQKPIKFWDNYPWAQSGSLENFQGIHMQGALRGHLCDSTAFLCSAAAVTWWRPARLRTFDCGTPGRVRSFCASPSLTWSATRSPSCATAKALSAVRSFSVTLSK